VLYPVTWRSRPQSLTAESRDSLIRLRVAEGCFGSRLTGPPAGFGGGASVWAARDPKEHEAARSRVAKSRVSTDSDCGRDHKINRIAPQINAL